MTEAQHPARRLLEALQEQGAQNLASAADGSLNMVVLDGDFDLEEAVAAVFPYQSGDHTVIGPECFTDAAAKVISYKGQNYYLAPEGGAARIAAERQRQIVAEGYTQDKDRGRAQELMAAARSYLVIAGSVDRGWPPRSFPVPRSWPWDQKYWKPAPTPEGNLVKAGALAAAAIDAIAYAR